MNLKKIFIVIVILLNLYCSNAQQYSSITLKNIGINLINRGCDITRSGTHKERGILYEVRRDANGIITHIGKPILNRSITNISPSPIYDFIERYVLEMNLIAPVDRELQLKDDKVSLNMHSISFVDTTCMMSLTTNEKAIKVEWNKNKKNISTMVFPKQYELIMGMNKIESENAFKDNLVNSNIPQNVPQQMDTTTIFKTENPNVFVQHNGYYLIKDMKSDNYYLKDMLGELTPLYNGNFPAETLSNLFNSIVSGDYTLHIEQNLYGYKKKTFNVSLNKFTSYCTQTGCCQYIGIESIKEKNIKAVIVYVNKYLNYNHLLYIDADIS